MASTANLPLHPPAALTNQQSIASFRSETTIGPDQSIPLNDVDGSKTSIAPLTKYRDQSADVERGSSQSTVAAADKLPPTDPDIVDFDGATDPSLATNWSPSKKWSTLGILSFLTLITPLASSMLAPGVPQIMEEFHATDSILESLIVSVYILGYAFGPLVIAPMSELYGRTPLYNATNVLFLIFTVACGVSSSLNMLIGFRFLQGVAGSAAITMGAGTCGDMFVREERGRAIGIWSMGPLLGPVIGPIGGGFLCEAKGWRWVFWVISIAMAVIIPATALFFRESYAPIILASKANRLRQETGNLALRSKLDSGLSPRKAFTQAIVRPMKMLFLSPIIAILATYTAIVYGYLYLLFTTFTLVFEGSYGFSQSVVGLSFLGLGVGMFIGLAIFYTLSDRIVKQKAAASGGEPKPEDRLVLVVPGAFAVPIGFFIYGWSAEYHVFWIVPIIGTAITGLGMIGASMPISTYVVDAFPLYAASATAAIAIWRSIVGALLPLAGLPMYQKLGVGWGNSLLGFIAVALIPVPILLLRYGERVRTDRRWQPRL